MDNNPTGKELQAFFDETLARVLKEHKCPVPIRMASLPGDVPEKFFCKWTFNGSEFYPAAARIAKWDEAEGRDMVVEVVINEEFARDCWPVAMKYGRPTYLDVLIEGNAYFPLNMIVADIRTEADSFSH